MEDPGQAPGRGLTAPHQRESEESQLTVCHCFRPPPAPGRGFPSVEADSLEQLLGEVRCRLRECGPREVLWLWLLPTPTSGPWCLVGIDPHAPAQQISSRVEKGWQDALLTQREFDGDPRRDPQEEVR